MVLSHAQKNAERHRKATEKWAARAQGSADVEEEWLDEDTRDDDLTPIESATVSAPVQAADDIPAQLMKLKELHEAGVLTDAEFDAKKTELLGRM